ncbi:glycine betaine ABC transporter substrate-binding protein [Desulfitobacterium sp.]|uniref:glycine betaine ABC transporter substrate-binding protein n=1 Tax=Desulfitobacterium sp. TaxID=49981 RepID=UPI002B20BB0F|nr:glycine betaine ABC transporter substrate-binding protein [Desulfitobacterium sp.]MEA4901413.1 glycine betaine ABC transporter substrate-binding protein [Desulfitobacterium sp.]
MKLFKKQWKHLFIWALVALLTAGLVSGCGTNPTQQESPSAGANKTVNIGYVNWAEDIAVSNLWKVILEEQGYTVNLTSLDLAPLFVGLNQGDIDIFVDAWLPVTIQAYWDKYKDNLDDYGIWYESEARIGLVVPKYVDINSIEELNTNKDKFKGKIIGIDPGSGIMKASNRAAQEYGLDYEIIQSSEAAMLTSLDKAYRNQEWIAVTAWNPHWMFTKYDLKYLEDPKKVYGDAERLHTLANKKFTQNNPEVADMLKSFKLSDQQLGTLESLINEGMKPEEASKKWIADNRELVDSWLK